MNDDKPLTPLLFTDLDSLSGRVPPTPKPEPMEPGLRVTLAVREAVKAACVDDDGFVVIGGDDVILGMIDALAGMIAPSPHVQTIRGRRLYLDEVRKALDSQVKRYQDAKAKRLVTETRPPLIMLDGGRE